MSPFEKAVSETVAEKQPEGAAIDVGLIMQLMTMLLQFIQNCPFGSAKAAIKAGSTGATVAAFNAVKKSGYTGNAVELAQALVAKGKAATDDELDETILLAESMPTLSNFMIIVALVLCFASTGMAAGPFPETELAIVSGPFPNVPVTLDVPEVFPTPPVEVETPVAVDTRPVLEMLVPADGDWCEYCNWWKARDNSDLPMQIKEVKTVTQPKFGYPTFRIPHGDDGKEWFIGNPTRPKTDLAVRALVKAWRKYAGDAADTATDAAAAGSTPYSVIASAYEAHNLRPDQVVVDPGCGDARALIIAVEQFNTQKAIGYEIDPVRAEAARQRVALAGLSDRIEIITGDSTKADLEGDVLFCYLYDETLEALQPQFKNFDLLLSYMHPLPGLPATKTGDLYAYQKKDAPTQAAVNTVTQMQWQKVWQPPWQVPGRECGRRSCTMCYGGYTWKQVPVQVTVQPPQAQVQRQYSAPMAMVGCARCNRRR